MARKNIEWNWQRYNLYCISFAVKDFLPDIIPTLLRLTLTIQTVLRVEFLLMNFFKWQLHATRCPKVCLIMYFDVRQLLAKKWKKIKFHCLNPNHDIRFRTCSKCLKAVRWLAQQVMFKWDSIDNSQVDLVTKINPYKLAVKINHKYWDFLLYFGLRNVGPGP